MAGAEGKAAAAPGPHLQNCRASFVAARFRRRKRLEVRAASKHRQIRSRHSETSFIWMKESLLWLRRDRQQATSQAEPSWCKAEAAGG